LCVDYRHYQDCGVIEKDMKIRLIPRHLDEVQEYLRSLPRGVMKVALLAITEYIIGDDRHGLRHDEPYKYVSRAQAYGRVSDAPAGYFSWKQFRYVMAKMDSGEIDPGTRQHSPTEASKGYMAKETQRGYTITNPKPGAITRAEAQPRQLALVGWRKMLKVAQDNMAGALRHANTAVNKLLKKKG
jgi:hypothetical protein